MTTHLDPDDFTAALEQAPEGPVAAHLAVCAPCRDELGALREQWEELAAIDVPEPSPLFWDHFPARVRDATRGAGAVAIPWWSTRRLVLAMSVAAVAVMLVAGLRWSASTSPVAAVADGGVGTSIEVPAFDDVAGLFETMPVDEVDAFAPAGTATWALVDDLTDEERTTFVQLIEQLIDGRGEARP